MQHARGELRPRKLFELHLVWDLRIFGLEMGLGEGVDESVCEICRVQDNFLVEIFKGWELQKFGVVWGRPRSSRVKEGKLKFSTLKFFLSNFSKVKNLFSNSKFIKKFIKNFKKSFN